MRKMIYTAVALAALLAGPAGGRDPSRCRTGR